MLTSDNLVMVAFYEWPTPKVFSFSLPSHSSLPVQQILMSNLLRRLSRFLWPKRSVCSVGCEVPWAGSLSPSWFALSTQQGAEIHEQHRKAFAG